MTVCRILALLLLSMTAISAQDDFRNVVEARLAKQGTELSKVCPVYDDWVAARV